MEAAMVAFTGKGARLSNALRGAGSGELTSIVRLQPLLRSRRAWRIRTQGSKRPRLHRSPPLLERRFFAALDDVSNFIDSLAEFGAADDPRDADEVRLGVRLGAVALERARATRLVDNVRESEGRASGDL